MATFDLDWKPKPVLDEFDRRLVDGLNTLGRRCVQTAFPITPWLTGRLARSLRYEVLEGLDSGKLELVWGSFDVPYAFEQEVGTSRRSGRHFLRRAADIEYPKLREYISKGNSDVL